MSSLRNWFRGSSSTASTATKKTEAVSRPSSLLSRTSLHSSNASKTDVRLTADQEAADIEDAMTAAALIMNDDIEGAEAQLAMRGDSSTFHLLALGVATFMRSVLGFEKEIMSQASSRLSECETRASADYRKAQKEASATAGTGGGYWYGGGASTSSATAGNVYPPGSEFALIHAEAQLMSAVVAVMHESLTEGIKGFYKLRKAYITLNGIMESEERALKQLQTRKPSGAASLENLKRTSLSHDTMPGGFDESEFADLEEKTDKGTDSDADLVDVSSGTSPSAATELTKPSSASISEPGTSGIEEKLAELSRPSSGGPVRPPTAADASSTPSRSTSSVDKVADVKGLQAVPSPSFTPEAGGTGTDIRLFTSTRDKFIHSGGNMCFGALLLIISMVPPAFSRLLQIVGFKGDRDRGVKMLWQSTKFPNVNGAVAGLLLLAYYNGILSFADILPGARDVEELIKRGSEDDEIVGYPKERCTALLVDMRSRYPDSRLWVLEEARVLANSQGLHGAIDMLRSNSDSKMKQVTALNMFELSINAMFALDWPLVRNSFLRCIELNEWSHAFYYYMVGCAELEQYRDAYHKAAKLANDGDSPALGEARRTAQKHKKAAEEYLRKAPSVAGRKRFMARQMPLEVFVCRKLQKWGDRAKILGVDLADATGSSPAMEMVYVNNGGKRMTPELLERARALLDWDRCTIPPDKVARVRDEADEAAIHAVVDAAFLRSLGRVDEGRATLEPVLKLDRTVFKGPTRDDYVLAATHYEVAAAAWVEACQPQHWPAEGDLEAYRRAKVDECHEYLEKVAKWEGFVLDARFGLRVQVGLDSVRWLRGKKGWA